jgi:transposase
MELLYPRCAGLDVHAASVVACLRLATGGTVTYEHRTVSTTTRGLLELADWLNARGVTHVAMEATGVYWKPVWHVLEDHCTLILANAMHIRNIPGRKSDKNDATWIADLLALGLIRSSFVPPAPIQDLRDLTRTRKQLVREMARHTQRIQKTLEDANVKLTEVISDILGTSGRAILKALVAGETDPERLADLTRGRLKATRAQLVAALHGRITDHHRFMLNLHLTQIAALEAAVAEVEARIREALGPFRAALNLLMTMPGVSETAASVILAEIGDDMTTFPSTGHLLSWAGLCPRLDESAGKRRSTRTRPGAPWLKTTLVQIAWAAARKKNSYFHAQFLRLKSRRGPKKAIVAVAASMLTGVYYMLRNGVEFRDLGDQYFVQCERDKKCLTDRLLRRLRDLGVEVEVKPAA